MADENKEPASNAGGNDLAAQLAEANQRAKSAVAEKEKLAVKYEEAKGELAALKRERAAERFLATLGVKPESTAKALKLMGDFKVGADGAVQGADELAAEIKDTLSPVHFMQSGSDAGGEKKEPEKKEPEKKEPAKSPGTPGGGETPKPKPANKMEAIAGVLSRVANGELQISAAN